MCIGTTALAIAHICIMESIDLHGLRRLVKSGSSIVWTGCAGVHPFVVSIKSPAGELSSYVSDPMTWRLNGDDTPEKVMRMVECTSLRGTQVSYTPPDTSPMGPSRRAAAFGVNLGGDCYSGTCKMYKKIDGCTMSYDIETSMKNAEPGAFDLVDAQILSIAAKCSCGREFYISSTRVRVSSSSMVQSFIAEVISHRPMWLIGWNCYVFDNECMRYHAPDPLKDVFVVNRTGMFRKANYGSVIHIPGVYNIDPLLFISKGPYGLTVFNLKAVSNKMGVTGKMAMPNMSEDVDDDVLRSYNMNDCVVAAEIWSKMNLDMIIPSLAVAACTPVHDCCKFTTGTIASLGYSSHLMSRGMIMTWGNTPEKVEYPGGHVIDPVLGVCNDVVVCDYSSMYPTIVASCNIDPHDFDISYGNDIPDGGVEIKGNTVRARLGDRIASFDSSRESPIREYMIMLTNLRAKYKKSDPPYATSLKFSANSLYGFLGYGHSCMYSPMCAMAITAIGRYCLMLASRVFTLGGLTVIYGDTDSCMVGTGARDRDVEEAVVECLDTLHGIMKGTPLDLMHMALERRYRRGVMIGKKRYCFLKMDGTIKYTGVSIVRRDVPDLCKFAALSLIKALLHGSIDDAERTVVSLVENVRAMCLYSGVTLGDVAVYTEDRGSKGYRYTSRAGIPVFIPEDEADLTVGVECDYNEILTRMVEEMERFTIPCGMGKVWGIVHRRSEL